MPRARLKSITGSRKVIETLNRFGHCISYHTVESLETDLAMSVSAKKTHIRQMAFFNNLDWNGVGLG